MWEPCLLQTYIDTYTEDMPGVILDKAAEPPVPLTFVEHIPPKVTPSKAASTSRKDTTTNDTQTKDAPHEVSYQGL